MRSALIAGGIAILLSCSIAHAEDKPAPPKDPVDAKPATTKEAPVEWRECDVRDVNADVKKALIGECEKVSGDNEVKGFKYFQTSTDAKVPLFKAEFAAGGKTCIVTCSPTGEIKSSDAKADPNAQPAK